MAVDLGQISTLHFKVYFQKQIQYAHIQNQNQVTHANSFIIQGAL